MRQIQQEYHRREGTAVNPERWAKGVIRKLLEATHGQWIYWNVQIHDDVAGTRATLKKEEIQKDRGTDGVGNGRASRRRSVDNGGQSKGLGKLFRGTGGILATGHSRRTGGHYADTAANTPEPGGTRRGRALISLL